MEFVVFLVVIVFVIILLFTRRGGSTSVAPDHILLDPLQNLTHEIVSLRKEIVSLTDNVSSLGRNADAAIRPAADTLRWAPPAKQAEAPEAQPVIPPTETVDIIPPPPAPETPPVEEAPPAENKIPRPAPVEEDAPETVPDPVYSIQPQQEPYEPSESWWNRWLRNNPDLEKFIGENLINKIGIAILVLGIAFFVKYAIDKDWINETGRVCIGMLCGALLVGVAHYLRNGYRSFSSVLAGGGIAVFYFTIAFAFHQYHMFGQTAAFIIMIIITAFAVMLSVFYDKIELAIIACVGGFLVPFLVATGDGNYTILFSYLIILDLGILALALFKRWPLLNILSLFFTEVIFAGWLINAINAHKPYSHLRALGFASAFYLIFLCMNMIYQVVRKELFKAFDFFLLLFISWTFYAGGMVILHEWNGDTYQGLFTLAMAMVNLLVSFCVHRSGKADKNLLYLLIGLTLTFATLTIPIQLHGHAITMFWSAEFVLLYWLSQRTGILLFRYSSVLVCLLSVVSLFMDWSQASANATTYYMALIFTNMRGVVTNIVAVASFATCSVLLKKSKDDVFLDNIHNRGLSRFLMGIAVVLLYVTCMFGVNLYFQAWISYDVPNVYHRGVTEIFALVLLVLMQRGIIKSSNPAYRVALLVGCFVLSVTSSGLIASVRDGVISATYPMYHMCFHWFDSVLLVALFLVTIRAIRDNWAELEVYEKPISIGFTAMIVAFLSTEIMHIYVMAFCNKNNTIDMLWQFGKAGLTSIWGVCSFALMWLGMKHRQKTFRIISLYLFLIVLVKLFLFDISGISEGGKIIAFILLGVLLLTVSFMYQKLKKIIFDDHKE